MKNLTNSQKYEYKTLNHWDEDTLNNLGKDGWKLISVTNHTAILMKELEEAPKETLEDIPITDGTSNNKEKVPMEPQWPIPASIAPMVPVWPSDCVWCNGTGRIHLPTTTSLFSTCNMCHGTGRPTLSGFPAVTVVNGAIFKDETLVESLKSTKELPVAPVELLDPVELKSTGEPEVSSEPTIELVEQKIIPEISPPQEKIIPTPDLDQVKTWHTATGTEMETLFPRKASRGDWTPEQMHSFYKTVARMSLKGPQLVPFVHGGVLYRPEPRPMLPLSDLAETVIASANTKVEPKEQSKSTYEAILDEMKKEQEAWVDQANTITKAKSKLFQDVLEYSNNNKSVEYNSNGVLEVSDSNSNKSSMKEYYSLPSDMEDILTRCSSYKDGAQVTVRWVDIETVVNMLGVQAPVEWQVEVEAEREQDNPFDQGGYYAYMWELRDAKQTLIDLGSLYENSNDLTDVEKAEEHIGQDWEALAKVYPETNMVSPSNDYDPEDWGSVPSKRTLTTSPYYDDYDPTKNYSKVLFKPSGNLDRNDAIRKILDKAKDDDGNWGC